MANLMVLGSDRRRADDLRALLRQDGHEVAWRSEVRGWGEAESEVRPDLILVAAESAHHVLAQPTSCRSADFPPPILFVQSHTQVDDEPFLADRLVDRIVSPYMHEELLARVDALIRVRRTMRRGASFPGLAPHVTGGPTTLRQWGRRVAALLGRRVPGYDKPLDPYLEVANRVAAWADRRDAYAPGHAERVTSFCAMIAEGLDLGAGETASLLRAAMLHDIGKVGLPVEVLHQKTPLLDDQVKWIRTHPSQGAALVQALDRDDEVAETIRCHHERPDGFGYYGVDGDQVPRAARVLAVAEVYDGMTTTLLHEVMSDEQALDRLRAFRGVSLDNDCVDALVDRLQPQSSRVAVSRPAH